MTQLSRRAALTRGSAILSTMALPSLFQGQQQQVMDTAGGKGAPGVSQDLLAYTLDSLGQLNAKKITGSQTSKDCLQLAQLIRLLAVQLKRTGVDEAVHKYVSDPANAPSSSVLVEKNEQAFQSIRRHLPNFQRREFLPGYPRTVSPESIRSSMAALASRGYSNSFIYISEAFREHASTIQSPSLVTFQSVFPTLKFETYNPNSPAHLRKICKSKHTKKSTCDLIVSIINDLNQGLLAAACVIAGLGSAAIGPEGPVIVGIVCAVGATINQIEADLEHYFICDNLPG